LIILYHHFQITHAIKRYLRIGCDLSSGDDIAQAAKGLSGTSLANLEPNRNDNSESHEKNQRKKSKIKTIKGISKLFYWEWPCQGQYDGYICARPLPHFGAWNYFSPSHVAKLWNTPLHQPQPSISQSTTPETQWTMSIAVESGKHYAGVCISKLKNY
jgi:hypothetical protein